MPYPAARGGGSPELARLCPMRLTGVPGAAHTPHTVAVPPSCRTIAHSGWDGITTYLAQLLHCLALMTNLHLVPILSPHGCHA